MEESPAQRFAHSCRRGVLAYQWDPEAERAVFYPRALPGLEWRESAGLGLLLIVEAIRQLRGECGERQVPGAEVALVHGNGGVLSSQCTAILGHV